METKVKKVDEKAIEEKTYQFPKGFKIKIIALSGALFFLGFCLTFPFKASLQELIAGQLRAIPGCPLSYQKLDLGLFLPGIHLSDVSIPGTCLRSPRPVKLDHIKLNLSFFGLFPPSLKLRAMVRAMDSEVKLYPRIGWGRTDLRLSKSRLSGKFLSSFTPYPGLLRGKVNLDGLVSLTSRDLKTADLKIIGKKLSIPAQKITVGFLPFNIPHIPFEKLKLVTTYKAPHFHIKVLELGSKGGPLHLQFEGKITLNKARPNLSQLHLKGRFRIGPEILNQIAALKLVLPPGKASKEGYYNLKLGGTLGRPIPRFL